MHKAFPLLVRKFPLPEGTSHCLKKNATARRKEMPLPGDCTARLLSVLITLEDPDLSFQQVQDMDQQYPTVSKIPMLDTRKFEQWQFRMQQYLQYEHYALWEVIEFKDSYVVPANDSSATTTNTTSGEKSGRTVTLTTEDMQRKKNDVKARTTLLLSLPDKHQLRFSKHKTARELWAAILKIFGGNEATKKMKKNLLKQQYGNFRVEGSKTLEQTFSRLQVIIGQLQFMGVEVEQDDLNQKFLTSLAPEWLMHTIVWRNGSDLDTISLDDLYNHLKDHALVADEEAPTEFALMANTSTESKECIESLRKELENLKKEKEVVDGKLAGLLTTSKDLDNLIKSHRSDKSKEGLGYTVVPPPTVQLYLSPKKDFNWTGLPECADDTVTDYSRPSPTVESSSEEDQNRNPSGSENVTSPIIPKYGCSRHMTGNISYLSDYEPFDGGYVSFGKGGCKITRKGTIKTGKLEFENVYFVKDLKYNLFSMSHICDNKNSVLFTDSECILLGRDFKLLDDANILLRTPRRLGHLNFKTMNKLVRYNLVRGLPTKCFENDHNCTACLKRKQHKASCKSKLVTSVSKPLHTLHMDLFSPTSVSSISHNWYCLVVTDDFSRFTWTFFLKTKDETSGILRKFITEIENLKDLKVKIIRCDNGGEFRNKELNDFCSQNGIKREFSNARTPQQNGVAERRNKSLIEAAKTMLADAKLPVTFWAEAVNTACYV
nr:hypothetical protein [Tanacetum cinerariifolium]